MENLFSANSKSLINLPGPAEGFRVASQHMVFHSGTTISSRLTAAICVHGQSQCPKEYDESAARQLRHRVSRVR